MIGEASAKCKCLQIRAIQPPSGTREWGFNSSEELESASKALL